MEQNRMSAPFTCLDGRDPASVFADLPSPAYILDEGKLKQNGAVLAEISRLCGCKILLAQKAFSNYDLYPSIEPFLAGTEASGLYEARLGREEMGGKEVHVFSAAYREDEFADILDCADHIVFNSVTQLRKFGKAAKAAGKSLGLRINPECSTQDGHGIYDPCAPGSRLGVTRARFDAEMDEKTLNLLDGLHFHTLCEQNADDFIRTYRAFEAAFGDVMPRMKWLNVGGGHHFTRPDYDRAAFSETVSAIRDKWGCTVYAEPGEAVALNAGFLISRVLDIVENNGTSIAILDASAACHMPDVIEMPYTPPLFGAATEADEDHPCAYRLAGPTCLSGDVIGDYFFKNSLSVGDLLVFGDMAIYTTCKNNTFNGMPLPDIFVRRADRRFEKLTDFGYEDFKMRLGRR